MSEQEPKSVEKSRLLREQLRKQRGISNEVPTQSHIEEDLPSRQELQKEITLKEKYKPVQDDQYASGQRGIYDMMSSNPILDKIARYWGFHLTQSLGLHIVMSLLFFIGISYLTSIAVNFTTSLILGFPLFDGFFMSLIGLFLVTLPLTTRIMFYGVGFYRKITGGL